MRLAAIRDPDAQRTTSMSQPVSQAAQLAALAIAGLATPPALAVAQEVRLAAPEAIDPRSDGTRRMAVLLAELADQTDPLANMFLSDQRAEVLRRRMQRATAPIDDPQAHLRLASELLNSNQIDEAHAQLDAAERLVERIEQRAPDRRGRRGIEQQLLLMRAVAWLRRGELDNCLSRHCCRSCILPIEWGGVHAERIGSETAIGYLTKLLEIDGEDDQARWLLTLAHMTLGSWPDGVPDAWRLPVDAFRSEQEFPRFEEVADQCGLAWTSMSGGAAVEDYDGDGLLDVALTGSGHREPIQLFRSRGDGTFEALGDAAALAGICGGLNLIQADYDNDGDVDLYVCRGAWYGEEGLFPDSLLRNRGDGRFDDVTEEAGLLSFHPSQTAVFADLDGDGWLDLVVGNETKSDGPPHRSELFLNRRDGTFVECSRDAGLDVALFVKGVVAGDFDDDGRIDLYLSIRSDKNLLLRNEPSANAPGFALRDVTATAGVGMPRMSFPACFLDFDNDGRLDLYAASNAGFLGDRIDDIGRFYRGLPTRSERPCLYRNLGGGRFAEVAKSLGADRAIFSMGANFGDVDNDGWLDLYLATGSPDLAALLPNRLLRNDGGRRFRDVTTASGTGHLQKGHGVAFADLDQDGDQDLLEHLGGGFTGDVYPCALFENPGNGHRWLALRLRGTKANRLGQGARIEVRVATGAEERSVHAVCSTGGSFGTSPLLQTIGLGAADRIVRVAIRWPGSDTRQEVTGLELDALFEVTEGVATPRRIERKPFKLGGGERLEVVAPPR